MSSWCPYPYRPCKCTPDHCWSMNGMGWLHCTIIQLNIRFHLRNSREDELGRTFLLNVLQFAQARSILLRFGTCLAPKETEDGGLEMGDVGPRTLTGASSLCPLFDGMVDSNSNLLKHIQQTNGLLLILSNCKVYSGSHQSSFGSAGCGVDAWRDATFPASPTLNIFTSPKRQEESNLQG
jgi:hypothetical protein